MKLNSQSIQYRMMKYKKKIKKVKLAKPVNRSIDFLKFNNMFFFQNNFFKLYDKKKYNHII
jgi:hypothetical protein